MTLPRTFEADLRQALLAQRPPAGASVELRERVDAMPDRVEHVHPIVAMLRGGIVPLAAVAVGAAAVVIGAFGLTREPITGLPPIGAGGVATGFDPAIEGPGFVTDVVPLAIILGLVVAVLGGATALRTFLSPRAGTWRGRGLLLLGLLGVAAGAWLVKFDVGLTTGVLSGAPLGYVEAPTGPLNRDDPLWISTAAPGEPTIGILSVQNQGPVPIRIEGLVRTYEGSAEVGRLTALWIPSGGRGFGAPALEDVRPFEPVTLAPGEGLTIYAASRAGVCAFGPDFDPRRQYSDTELGGYSIVGPQFTVAYSVFALSSTMQIDMHETFAQPIRGGCSAGETPG